MQLYSRLGIRAKILTGTYVYRQDSEDDGVPERRDGASCKVSWPNNTSILVSVVMADESLAADSAGSGESVGTAAQSSDYHHRPTARGRLRSFLGWLEGWELTPNSLHLARIIHPAAKEENRKPDRHSICESWRFGGPALLSRPCCLPQ
jgi:hypothetical protein